MKGRSSFPECCWMCFRVIREYRNRVEGFAEDSHACVCKTQDSKEAAMTPFCGRALADPKLQKVIFEQADPLGITVGGLRLPPSSIPGCFQWKAHVVVLLAVPTSGGKEALEICLCPPVCLSPHHPPAILSKLAAGRTLLMCTEGESPFWWVYRGHIPERKILAKGQYLNFTVSVQCRSIFLNQLIIIFH